MQLRDVSPTKHNQYASLVLNLHGIKFLVGVLTSMPSNCSLPRAANVIDSNSSKIEVA